MQPSAKAAAQLINHSPLNAEALKTGRYIVDVDLRHKEKSDVYPIALVSCGSGVHHLQSPAPNGLSICAAVAHHVLSGEGRKYPRDYAGAALRCLIRCAVSDEKRSAIFLPAI